ncbi:hypothetical protein OPT61_g684 [Boeremia exigua]|uniref:Uncharacterized protein n=1 Tax=Boeremia exigua TaxID=749465 RepID=A0ACC2ITC5_9PLEO|nr:hypothetical protein OPT61_g684 [Boeremia exigua]
MPRPRITVDGRPKPRRSRRLSPASSARLREEDLDAREGRPDDGRQRRVDFTPDSFKTAAANTATDLNKNTTAPAADSAIAVQRVSSTSTSQTLLRSILKQPRAVDETNSSAESAAPPIDSPHTFAVPSLVPAINASFHLSHQALLCRTQNPPPLMIDGLVHLLWWKGHNIDVVILSPSPEPTVTTDDSPRHTIDATVGSPQIDLVKYNNETCRYRYPLNKTYKARVKAFWDAGYRVNFVVQALVDHDSGLDCEGVVYRKHKTIAEAGPNAADTHIDVTNKRVTLTRKNASPAPDRIAPRASTAESHAPATGMSTVTTGVTAVVSDIDKNVTANTNLARKRRKNMLKELDSTLGWTPPNTTKRSRRTSVEVRDESEWLEAMELRLGGRVSHQLAMPDTVTNIHPRTPSRVPGGEIHCPRKRPSAMSLRKANIAEHPRRTVLQKPTSGIAVDPLKIRQKGTDQGRMEGDNFNCQIGSRPAGRTVKTSDLSRSPLGDESPTEGDDTEQVECKATQWLCNDEVTITSG